MLLGGIGRACTTICELCGLVLFPLETDALDLDPPRLFS